LNFAGDWGLAVLMPEKFQKNQDVWSEYFRVRAGGGKRGEK
jgi:hypothetical protein